MTGSRVLAAFGDDRVLTNPGLPTGHDRGSVSTLTVSTLTLCTLTVCPLTLCTLTLCTLTVGDPRRTDRFLGRVRIFYLCCWFFLLVDFLLFVFFL